MIVTGFALAVLTVGGMYLIYAKLPSRVKRFLQKHSLFTDLLACVLTYMLFGGTLIALFAAAFAGILVSIMLALMENPKTSYLVTQFFVKMGEAKDQFINFIANLAPEVPMEQQQVKQ